MTFIVICSLRLYRRRDHLGKPRFYVQVKQLNTVIHGYELKIKEMSVSHTSVYFPCATQIANQLILRCPSFFSISFRRVKFGFCVQHGLGKQPSRCAESPFARTHVGHVSLNVADTILTIKRRSVACKPSSRKAWQCATVKSRR